MCEQIGIGILPDFAVFPADRLHPVSLNPNTPPPEFQAELLLVMHEDVRRSPSVRAVADYFGEVLGGREREISGRLRHGYHIEFRFSGSLGDTGYLKNKRQCECWRYRLSDTNARLARFRAASNHTGRIRRKQTEGYLKISASQKFALLILLR